MEHFATFDYIWAFKSTLLKNSLKVKPPCAWKVDKRKKILRIVKSWGYCHRVCLGNQTNNGDIIKKVTWCDFGLKLILEYTVLPCIVQAIYCFFAVLEKKKFMLSLIDLYKETCRLMSNQKAMLLLPS